MKPEIESAWEMQRRLRDEYGIDFIMRCKDKTILATHREYSDYYTNDIEMLPELIAIRLMKEIEKELKEN